ncbi:MAG: hypothetical protein N2450_07100 [bacterium]|nr:hypothetical protein [bacterium]
MFQNVAFSVGIPVRLETSTICSIFVPLPGLSLDESARLFQARINDWYKKDPRPTLHVSQFGDSAFVMADDQILWAFGPSEGIQSGYNPSVLAYRTELRLREIVLNKETVKESRDPLSKLMLALVVIPLGLVILSAAWIRFMRYLNAIIFKSPSGFSETSISYYNKKSIEITLKILTTLGVVVLILFAILGWMYLFSTTRALLNYFFPIFGNLISVTGSLAKWILNFAIVFGGIYLLLRFIKIRLTPEFEREILDKRFAKLYRLGLILAIILSLPMGIGLPEPIAWALPIATFLVVAFAALPIVRSLIVSVILPLDPTHQDIVIHWKDKDWKLDQLRWINAHIINSEGEEAMIPLHWFLNDSETLYIVSRKYSVSDEQHNSES